MLITEEILRHLVTVLEDRGPAEDLPPAAAPRTAGSALASFDTDEPDDDDASEEPELDETVALAQPEPAADSAETPADEQPVEEASTEETAAAVAGGEPADEDRTAG